MCIDAVLEKNRNRVDGESLDVGDSLGGDEWKLLVVVALDGRESFDHEVGDCLVLGGINLELHNAFAPRNSFKNEGEEYIEAEQCGISWNIRNVKQCLAVEQAHVLCRQHK